MVLEGFKSVKDPELRSTLVRVAGNEVFLLFLSCLRLR